MNILITGDSFAADWSCKYPASQGWPNLLAAVYKTHNVAQAGCSEYRIYQQLCAQDLDRFDLIIVSHTSPYRIYTQYNPLRNSDALHHHCDLIYSDVKHLAENHFEYQAAAVYFEKFFSLEYAEFCYSMIREKINTVLHNHKAVHIAHIKVPGAIDLDFTKEFERNAGTVNHYNTAGNHTVFQTIVDRIKQL